MYGVAHGDGSDGAVGRGGRVGMAGIVGTEKKFIIRIRHFWSRICPSLLTCGTIGDECYLSSRICIFIS